MARLNEKVTRLSNNNYINEINKVENLIKIFDVLRKHFEYTIEDIHSYDELTPTEKQIISEDFWNKWVINQ